MHSILRRLMSQPAPFLLGELSTHAYVVEHDLISILPLVFFMLSTASGMIIQTTRENQDNTASLSSTPRPATEEPANNTQASLMAVASAGTASTTSVSIRTNGSVSQRLITVSPAGRAFVQGKANYYDSYTQGTSSDSGLSGGAIAGIVIAILFVLFCCCIAGCCASKKSGHWEDAKVWVQDWHLRSVRLYNIFSKLNIFHKISVNPTRLLCSTLSPVFSPSCFSTIKDFPLDLCEQIETHYEICNCCTKTDICWNDESARGKQPWKPK